VISDSYTDNKFKAGNVIDILTGVVGWLTGLSLIMRFLVDTMGPWRIEESMLEDLLITSHGGAHLKGGGMNGHHGTHHGTPHHDVIARDRAHLSHHSTDEGLNHGRHAKAKRHGTKR